MKTFRQIPVASFIFVTLSLIFSLMYREWFGAPQQPLSAAATLAWVVLVLMLPSVTIVYVVKAISYICKRKRFLFFTSLCTPLLCVGVLFAIPERKLIQTKQHFFAHQQEYEQKRIGRQYGEFFGLYSGWSIVFDASNQPHTYPGDSVTDGVCSNGGSVETQLADKWYICRRYTDIP